MTQEPAEFRHYDRPNGKQVVSIQWERLEARDDCSDKPDERDDGFWPSRDPDAAGYVDPDKFDEQQEKAEARMKAWQDDDWFYIGVIARAHISIPIGGTSFCMYTIDSPGLWGIESDAGEYLAEVFEEQKAELLAHLATLGTWAAGQVSNG